ncbi:MAG: hypothetical protein ABSC16_00640 [Candidatus Dormibacteria bacterium]|jgi:hypothetical protein
MVRPRLAAVALLLTACGGTAATATPTPPCRSAIHFPSPSAVAAPVSAAADQAQVDPGATVTFTETITGPATVQVDCSDPLQVLVTDSTALSVYSGYSEAAAADACGTLTLTGGASESYQVAWPVDPSLPGGTYTATLVLGDAPQLTLSLAVGTLPGAC